LICLKAGARIEGEKTPEGPAMTFPASRPETSDRSGPMSRLTTAILDVDGVLLSSPHEQAWREALAGFADPARFTPAFYRSEVAGKPRRDGALAALIGLGVQDAARRAGAYATLKQARLEALIGTGRVAPFSDAIRFVQALKARGIRMAAASSSLNATGMMRSVTLEDGSDLLDLFALDVSGHAVAHGKPAPDLFLLAAAGMQARPGACFVVEDSPSGIRAARSAGMQGLGVARAGETALLMAAGATLVVESLDAVDLTALTEGRLESGTS